jgi:hypothetical protein
MSYNDFLENLKTGEVQKMEEDILTWKNMSPAEKAKTIQEVKESGDENARKYLLEVSEKALENANTEAGGSGDVTGDEIDIYSKGGEPKMATDLSDDDPEMSDKTKLASAAGIGAGLGAVNMAKKLRRERAKGDVVAASNTPSS